MLVCTGIILWGWRATKTFNRSIVAETVGMPHLESCRWPEFL